MLDLILFNKIKNEDILNSIVNLDQNGSNQMASISKLVTFGFENNFKNNLWFDYLAFILAYNENPFSIACENKGKIQGDMTLIYHDIQVFYDLFKLDLNKLFGEYASSITNFNVERQKQSFYNQTIVEMISDFASDLASANNFEEFYTTIVSFYQVHGVGDFGFHKAFRISDDSKLIPIKDVINVNLDDLIGYEAQKEELVANTKSFVAGKFANNVLLYGDSGTGKSTSIKAILNMFASKGLRIIEVYKHQMKEVANLMAELKKRNYFFIIYMDDLSFEENEVEYKYLKSIIEGGLEAKPKNVLVYASSNRRHLIRENASDNNTVDDLHRNESAQEKISLAYRFGIQILFTSLSNKDFLDMVKELARRHNIDISETELISQARVWELRHGNLSGRTAEQFIMYLCGENQN